MKVIIAGGRDYQLTDEDYLRLDDLHDKIGITEVVSGKAKGADTGGEEWARSRGIPVKDFPADWDKHGKRAGPIRNFQMAEYVGNIGAVVLFPGGIGTQNMRYQAVRHGLMIFDWGKPAEKN
jgi:hypothetical protein